MIAEVSNELDEDDLEGRLWRNTPSLEEIDI